MQDYIARYTMDFNPFIKNKHDIIMESNDYKELKLRLDYLLKNKGFGIITGGAGIGKTTAIRTYVNNLNGSLYKVIYTSLSTLTVSEFYKHLATELGLVPKHKKNDNFRDIQSEISRLALEKRVTPVIIIDEANYINNGVLNDLKMLFNFEMDSRDRAVVLLVGLPQLNNTLKLSANEPLRQRITMNFNIDSLTKEETIAYIKTKLKGAKSTMEIFNPNAFEAIANASNGIPRLINKICNASLMIGASKSTDNIDSEIIMSAVNDMELI
ncbi:MAG: AAA family ATPase [Methanobrevibacter sp.]|jgi:type II secretory pathway predicted ATPase ExeA|nr:AAA family ATPase [Methanobrevibacter sp.]